MPDVTPEQDRLNSARGRAFLAAQMLRQHMETLVQIHVQGRIPSEQTMQEIEAEYADVAAYFALLRKEG